MPQLPRSDSASSGAGFSWKPVTRPSRSCSTTPYSRVSGTFLTDSVAIPPACAVACRQRRQVDVRERVAGDHEEGLIAEEVAAGPHAAGGAQQLLLEAVAEPIAEVVA